MNPWWKLIKTYSVKTVDCTTVKESGVYYNSGSGRYQAVFMRGIIPAVVISIPESELRGITQKQSQEIFERLFKELENFKKRKGIRQKSGQWLAFFDEKTGKLRSELSW